MSARRRVVINGRFLTQRVTGVQRYARQTLLALDRYLSDQRDWPEDIEVQLVVPKGASPLTLTAIETVSLPYFRGHLWEQISLPAFARDALLVGLNYSGPVLKSRQLITIHDATVAAMPDCFSAKYRLVQNTLIRVLRSRVASVMTVSEFSKEEIATRYGVPKELILVGREGWEHSVALSDTSGVLERYGLQAGRYLLSVGSIKPNKNTGLLAEALRLLPEFPLTVAVAGMGDARIFNSVDPIPPSIRLLGFVSDEDLGVLYSHAAWFVFPSLYEGFGLPALEAMANGCPVLAAKAGSLPEVCGEAAIYFDPLRAESLAEAFQQVIDDPNLRGEFIARHVGCLTRYTWESNARILANEIIRILDGRSPQRHHEARGLAAPPT